MKHVLTHQLIIEADSEQHARALASLTTLDPCWCDTKKVTCGVIFVLTNIRPYKELHFKAQRFVICAESEKVARTLAANNSGNEGPEHWQDPTKTSCVILDAKQCGVICRDFTL